MRAIFLKVRVGTKTAVSQQDRVVWRRSSGHISWNPLAYSFSGLKLFFGVHLQLQLCTSTSITSWWRHFINRQVEVEDGLQKYFWDRQTIFRVAKYDKSSLGCLHTTRSMWATRALELILSWTFAKFESPLYICSGSLSSARKLGRDVKTKLD